MTKQWTVVIVGRTNVGKSTLFNRLSSTVKSLTLDREGITRDILKDSVEWQGKSFELIDTGGIQFKKSADVITEKIRLVALQTLERSDIALLVIDGSTGVVQEDRDIARLLHKMGKKVLVVINKVDRAVTSGNLHEGAALGFSHDVAVSAEHGTAIGDVLEHIVQMLPPTTPLVSVPSDYNVVFLGRPNV